LVGEAGMIIGQIIYIPLLIGTKQMPNVRQKITQKQSVAVVCFEGKNDVTKMKSKYQCTAHEKSNFFKI